MRLRCRPVALPMFQPKRPSPTQRVSEPPRLDGVISTPSPQIPTKHHRCPVARLYERCATVHKFVEREVPSPTVSMHSARFATATFLCVAWYGSTHKKIKGIRGGDDGRTKIRGSACPACGRQRSAGARLP